MALTVVALLAGAAIDATTALADWSVDETSTGTGALFLSHAGAIGDFPCGGGADYTTFSLFGLGGNRTFSLHNGQNGIVQANCAVLPMSDKAGNIYYTGVDHEGHMDLVSIDAAGAYRWSSVFPADGARLSGLNSGENAFAVDPSGNLWVQAPYPGDGSKDQIWEIDGATGVRLRAINVTDVAPAGVALSNWPGINGTSTGVAVQLRTGVVFIDTQGALRRFVPFRADLAGAITYQTVPARNGLLVGFLHQGSSDCAGDFFAVSYVNDEGTNWTYRGKDAAAGACSRTRSTLSIRAAPDGGAVVVGDARTGVAGTALTRISATGTALWTVDVPHADQLPPVDPQDHHLRVSSDGTIAVEVGWTCDPSAAADICNQLMLYSLGDGHTIRPIALRNSRQLRGVQSIVFAPGEVVYSDNRCDPLSAFCDHLYSVEAATVPNVTGDEQLANSLPAEASGAMEPPPLAAPPSVPPPPPTNPAPDDGGVSFPTIAACHATGRSLGQRLLSSLSCGLAKFTLSAKCGRDFALHVVAPLKGLKAVKTAKGLYVLGKLREPAKSVARWHNQILRATYIKTAPRGFRSGPETLKTFQSVKKAIDLGNKLITLARSVSAKDFERIMTSFIDIIGVKSCVTGLTASILN